ncbi:MAG: hypothetical protein ACYC97_13360, partial [Metallibacterium sp.]
SLFRSASRPRLRGGRLCAGMTKDKVTPAPRAPVGRPSAGMEPAALRALSTARIGFPVDKLMMKPAKALSRLPRATH